LTLPLNNRISGELKMLKGPCFMENARGSGCRVLCRLAGTALCWSAAQVAQAQDTTEAAAVDHACAEDQYKALGGPAAR
jgi:hypothetical protein